MPRKIQSGLVTTALTHWRPAFGLFGQQLRGRKPPRRAVAGRGMIGRTLSHYRVLERIGKGGMSLVYKALDLKLDRLVALKFLPPHLLAADDAVARFHQEARAISALNHPHIATIYELEHAQGEIFLALEYLPGGTLRSLIHRLACSGQRLSPRRLLEFALAIAEALSHAHRHGIIHRDVKADNVMLSAEGTAKLTDFGLARLRGSSHLTQAGSIMGTAAYMSPEQARGQEVDHRSDIFSLGVVLYEMATGELPFRGPHEARLLSEILHATPPSVSAVRSDLPSGYGRVVRRALEKDPDLRYPRTDELVTDLRALAAEPELQVTAASTDEETRPITPLRTTENRKLWRFLRSGRRWLRASVVSLLALACGAVLPPWRGELWSRLTEIHKGEQSPGAQELYSQARDHLQRYESVESLDRAIDLLRRAVATDPRYASAHAGLGEAFWRKYKLTKDSRWIEHAGDSCRRSLELGGSQAPVHVTLGLIYSGTGRFEEAVAEFERALSLDPLNADACRELANAHEALGRHKEAEANYLKAIEFRASDWAGYNDLGAFYWRHGRYGEAEARFRKVIELTPDNARGQSNLGGLLVMMARYEEATEVLERSLAIKPTYSAYSNLGTAYFFQGRYQAAARMMEKAVELRNEHYQLWGNLADVYRHIPGGMATSREAYERAIQLARRQLAVNPGDAAVRASMAGYWAGLGRKNKALAEIREARRLAPDNVNIVFRAALTYQLCGLREESLAAIEAALQGGYSSAEVARHPDLAQLRADSRYDGLRSLVLR